MEFQSFKLGGGESILVTILCVRYVGLMRSIGHLFYLSFVFMARLGNKNKHHKSTSTLGHKGMLSKRPLKGHQACNK